MAKAKRQMVPVKPVEVVTLELSVEEAEDLMAVLMRRVFWNSGSIGIYQALSREGLRERQENLPWKTEDHD